MHAPEPIEFPWKLLDFWNQNANAAIHANSLHSDQPLKRGEFCVLRGNIFFGPNVVLGDFVRIIGPAYIGAGSIIGDYASVSNSYVGAEALVGEHTILRNSVIGDRTALSHQNLVCYSVLVDDVHLPAVVVIASLRKFGEHKAYWRGQQYPLTPPAKKHQGVYGCSLEDRAGTTGFTAIMPGAYLPPDTMMTLPGVIKCNGELHPFDFKGLRNVTREEAQEIVAGLTHVETGPPLS